MKTFASRAASTAAVLALSWLAPTVQAAANAGTDASDVRSRSVYFGDLNLQSEDGIARLHGRIARAAKVVCPETSLGFLPQSQWRKHCRALAMSEAVARINQPLLTRYHRQRTLVAAR